MKTLVTLIIGIIIGAASMFYGLKNNMISMEKIEKSIESVEHKQAVTGHVGHSVVHKTEALAPAITAEAQAPAASESQAADVPAAD